MRATAQRREPAGAGRAPRLLGVEMPARPLGHEAADASLPPRPERDREQRDDDRRGEDDALVDEEDERDVRDERWAMIDTRATAFSGIVVIVALVGTWLYELAQGGDGSPYGQFMAVAGIAYVVAVAWFRFRS